MINGATIECRSADETLAVLVITPELDAPLREGAILVGYLKGPYCDRARTLPAEFTLRSNDDGTLTASIVDPCYSTPDLKMEYELELWYQQETQRSIEFATRIELKK